LECGIQFALGKCATAVRVVAKGANGGGSILRLGSSGLGRSVHGYGKG
jgi:hypothetical protein